VGGKKTTDWKKYIEGRAGERHRERKEGGRGKFSGIISKIPKNTHEGDKSAFGQVNGVYKLKRARHGVGGKRAVPTEESNKNLKRRPNEVSETLPKGARRGKAGNPYQSDKRDFAGTGQYLYST